MKYFVGWAVSSVLVLSAFFGIPALFAPGASAQATQQCTVSASKEGNMIYVSICGSVYSFTVNDAANGRLAGGGVLPLPTETIEVPGPTVTETVEVPGPTVTETVEVPGATVTETVEVPGPVVEIPGPTVTLPVPGPTTTAPGTTVTVPSDPVTIRPPAVTETVRIPVSFPVTLPMPTETVRVAGPERVVAVPGPTRTVTASPNIPERSQAPQPTATATVTETRQPQPTRATVGPAQKGEPAEIRTLTETIVQNVLLGTLASLVLAGLGLLLMFLGYIIGQKDAEKDEDKFLEGLLDAAKIRQRP